MLDRDLVAGPNIRMGASTTCHAKSSKMWFVLISLTILVVSTLMNIQCTYATPDTTSTGRRIKKDEDVVVDDDDSAADDDWDSSTISPAPSASDQPSMAPSVEAVLDDGTTTENNYTKVQMPLLRINITAPDTLGMVLKKAQNTTYTSPDDIINNWMELFLHTFFKDSSRYRTSFLEVISDTVRWNDTANSTKPEIRAYSKNDIFEVSGFAIFKGTIVKKLDEKPKKAAPKKTVNKNHHKKQKKDNNKRNKEKNKNEAEKNRKIVKDDDDSIREIDDWVRPMGRTSISTNVYSSTIPSETELSQIIFAYFSFWGTDNLLSYIEQNNNIGWDVTDVQISVNGNKTIPQVNTTSNDSININTTMTNNNNDNNTNSLQSATDDNSTSRKSLLQNPPAILMITLGVSIVVFGFAIFILLCQRRKSLAPLDENDDSTVSNNKQHNTNVDCTLDKSNLYPMQPYEEDDDDIMTLKSGRNRNRTGNYGIDKIDYDGNEDDRDDIDSDNRSMTNLYPSSSIDIEEDLNTYDDTSKTTNKDKRTNISRNEYLTTISKYGFVSLLAGSVSPRTKLNTILDVEETSTDNEISAHSRKIGLLPHFDKSGHSRCDSIPENDTDTDDKSSNIPVDELNQQQLVPHDEIFKNDTVSAKDEEYIFFYDTQNEKRQTVTATENTSKHQTTTSSTKQVVPDVVTQKVESAPTPYSEETQTAPYVPSSVRQHNFSPYRRNNKRTGIVQPQETTSTTNLINMIQVSSMSKAVSLSKSRNNFTSRDNNMNDTNVVEHLVPESSILQQESVIQISSTVPTVFAMDDQSINTYDNEMSIHSGTRRSRCNSVGSRVSVGYTTSECDIVSIADDFSMRS
jgi:hypothetical protein